jgi:hypothetical protein
MYGDVVPSFPRPPACVVADVPGDVVPSFPRPDRVPALARCDGCDVAGSSFTAVWSSSNATTIGSRAAGGTISIAVTFGGT